MARWRNRGRGLIAAAIFFAVAGLAPVCAVAADSPLALAQKALKAGKADLALRAINAALSGNALKGADIAKAYYVRGLAFAKTGNQAAAIADFNNALYLKGLSEPERQAATAAKAAAYQAAGVPVKAEANAGGAPAEVTVPSFDTAETQTAPLPKGHKKKPPAVAAADAPASGEQAASAEPLPWSGKPLAAPMPIQAAAAPAETTASAPAKPAESSGDNTFNSMLGGLFAMGKAAPAPAPTAAAASPPPEAAATTQPPAAVQAAPVWKTASRAAGTAPAAAGPKATKTGGFYLQVASLRTTAEAQALADKLARDHAPALTGLQTSVQPTVLGNMGTFYSVRLGPVASKAAGNSVCANLRKEGVDCYFATP